MQVVHTPPADGSRGGLLVLVSGRPDMSESRWSQWPSDSEAARRPRRAIRDRFVPVAGLGQHRDGPWPGFRVNRRKLSRAAHATHGESNRLSLQVTAPSERRRIGAARRRCPRSTRSDAPAGRSRFRFKFRVSAALRRAESRNASRSRRSLSCAFRGFAAAAGAPSRRRRRRSAAAQKGAPP